MPFCIKGDTAVAGAVPAAGCPEWAKAYFNDPGAFWELCEGVMVRIDNGNYSALIGLQVKPQATINAMLNTGHVRQARDYPSGDVGTGGGGGTTPPGNYTISLTGTGTPA